MSVLISIIWLSVMPRDFAHASVTGNENAAGFKVHPPAGWERDTETKGPFEIYRLKNSKSKQTVIFEKLNIPASESGFDFLAHNRIAIENGRARLFAYFGLSEYRIRDLRDRTDKKNRRFQVLSTEYRNLANQPMQIVERQYPAGGFVYRISYSEQAYKIEDSARADRIVESFQPEIPVSDREPAAEAVSGTEAPRTEIPKDAANDEKNGFWYRFREKFGTPASEEFCKDIPESERVANDQDRSVAQGVALGSLDCLQRQFTGLWEFAKFATNLALLDSKTWSQVGGAISNVASDWWNAKENSIFWAFHRVTNGISSAFPKFKCYSLEKRIGMVCNTTINTALMTKLFYNAGLSLAEKAKLSKLMNNQYVDKVRDTVRGGTPDELLKQQEAKFIQEHGKTAPDPGKMDKSMFERAPEKPSSEGRTAGFTDVPDSRVPGPAPVPAEKGKMPPMAGEKPVPPPSEKPPVSVLTESAEGVNYSKLERLSGEPLAKEIIALQKGEPAEIRQMLAYYRNLSDSQKLAFQDLAHKKPLVAREELLKRSQPGRPIAEATEGRPAGDSPAAIPEAPASSAAQDIKTAIADQPDHLAEKIVKEKLRTYSDDSISGPEWSNKITNLDTNPAARNWLAPLARENPDLLIKLINENVGSKASAKDLSKFNNAAKEAYEKLAKARATADASTWSKAGRDLSNSLRNVTNPTTFDKTLAVRIGMLDKELPGFSERWKNVLKDRESAKLARQLLEKNPELFIRLVHEKVLPEIPGSALNNRAFNAAAKDALKYMEEHKIAMEAKKAAELAAAEKALPETISTDLKASAFEGTVDEKSAYGMLKPKIDEIAARKVGENLQYPKMPEDFEAIWKNDKARAEALKVVESDPNDLWMLLAETRKGGKFDIKDFTKSAKSLNANAELAKAAGLTPAEFLSGKIVSPIKTAELRAITSDRSLIQTLDPKIKELAKLKTADGKLVYPDLAKNWAAILRDQSNHSIIAKLAREDADDLMKKINETALKRDWLLRNKAPDFSTLAKSPPTTPSLSPTISAGLESTFATPIDLPNTRLAFDGAVEKLQRATTPEGNLLYPKIQENWKVVLSDKDATELALKLGKLEPNYMLTLVNDKVGSGKFVRKGTKLAEFKKEVSLALESQDIIRRGPTELTSRYPVWKEPTKIDLKESFRKLDDATADEVLKFALKTLKPELLQAWEEIRKSPRARSAGIDLAKLDGDRFVEAIEKLGTRGNIPLVSKRAQEMKFTVLARRALEEPTHDFKIAPEGKLDRLKLVASDTRRALQRPTAPEPEVFQRKGYEYGTKIKLDGGFQTLKSHEIGLAKLDAAINATRDEALIANWNAIKNRPQAVRRAISLARANPDIVAELLNSSGAKFGKGRLLPRSIDFIRQAERYAAENGLTIDKNPPGKLTRLASWYLNSKIGQVMQAGSVAMQNQDPKDLIEIDSPESPIGLKNENGERSLSPDQIIAPPVDDKAANNGGIAPSVDYRPAGTSIGGPAGEPIPDPAPSSAGGEGGAQMIAGNSGLGRGLEAGVMPIGAATTAALNAMNNSNPSNAPQTPPAPPAPPAAPSTPMGIGSGENSIQDPPPPQPAPRPQATGSSKRSSAQRSAKAGSRSRAADSDSGETRDAGSNTGENSDRPHRKKNKPKSADQIRHANASESTIFKSAPSRIKSSKGLEAQLRRLAAVPGGNHGSIAKTYHQLTSQKNGQELANRLAARARHGDFREVVRFLESHKHLKISKMSKQHVKELVDGFDSHEDGQRRPAVKHRKPAKKKHKRHKSPTTLDGEEPADIEESGIDPDEP